MSEDEDDATRAAAQDILAALHDFDTGPVGHGPIRLGGGIAASVAARAAEPVPEPELAPAERMPVGHGTIRLGGPVVAAAPDDALESAQHEILAALFGAPTPGVM
ncbi:MAG TPA: hypothetical protein VGO80_18430 [Solirubrobacteraceae bacterium]|nr:hypothetical protein [Solirubrobacteraceae bacterium]